MKVIIAEEEKEKKQSYQLRFNVMCRDLGWLSAQDYVAPEEKDEYDIEQSIVFLALDNDGNAIGTSRIILPGKLSLPVSRYFELESEDEIIKKHGDINFAVEISRFIALQNNACKQHDITRMLCMAMLARLLRMNASHAFVSADFRFFRLLRVLGIYFDQVGREKWYMGSKTIPGIVNLTLLFSTIKRERPQLYEIVNQELS